MWKRCGTPQNFFLVFIMNLKNNYLLKKLLKWANKKNNNFNISNVAFLKENNKKHLEISLSKSWWYDLQFLRYRAKQTEIGNLSSFFALLPPASAPLKKKIKTLKKQEKFLEISSFYTCVTKITIIWCTVSEIQGETDMIFCHFVPFFALFCIFCPMIPNIKILKKWKKRLEIFSFYTYMHVYHNDHMIYGSWNVRHNKIFVILGHFLPFHSPHNPKNQNFEKLKRKHLEILSFYTCAP